MPRVILHLDLDAFFCAVEEQHNPTLKGVPFAVGGSPEKRGVVASCSYPARVFGVRSAMPMAQAVRRCPDLVIVHQHFEDYRHYSREVRKRLYDLAPLVEPLSIDEAFLDVTGLPGTPAQIARRLQAQINDELDLPCSLGVATNKLVAKIANNIGKATAPHKDRPPNAVKVIPPGNEAAFLAPLPIRELWGVGPKTAERLALMNIRTVGDITRWSQADLVARFGKHGDDLYRRSRGLDDRPVETEYEAKSISKETTFGEDVYAVDVLLHTLRQLADGVGRRLRRDNLSGTTIKIKLRWSDFTTITRQDTLVNPINTDREIYQAAEKLFYAAWPRGKRVRLIGVGITGLEESRRQLSLWDAEEEKQEQRLQSTLDALRDRFGDKSIKRGSDLKDD